MTDPRSAAAAAPPALRRMRLIATLMLVAMAALFLATRAWGAGHAWVGYLQAFAEAAMVGGLADWFAVTALFRHPLGVPVPHTAIIPRNKDRIGDTLAAFLRSNFLTPHVVGRRMRRLDIALAAGNFLGEPLAGDGRMRRGASRLAADMLGALDQQRLGGMVKGAMVARLRDLDLGPLLGQALTAAIAEGRHKPLIDSMIGALSRTVDSNEEVLREMIQRRAGAVLRWTGLDEKLATAVLGGVNKMLAEMADDPDHPLRARAEAALVRLADDLQHDADTQAKVARIKAELLANPALGHWLEGLWEQARAAMLRIARDPDRAMAGPIGDAIRQLGETLRRDAGLRATINRFARRAVVGTVAGYGDGIVRLVSDTVRGWDAQTITGRLENAVGRDLQYIRINGTLVGGLVGLCIHAADRALG